MVDSPHIALEGELRPISNSTRFWERSSPFQLGRATWRVSLVDSLQLLRGSFDLFQLDSGRGPVHLSSDTLLGGEAWSIHQRRHAWPHQRRTSSPKRSTASSRRALDNSFIAPDHKDGVGKWEKHEFARTPSRNLAMRVQGKESVRGLRSKITM